LSDKRCPKCGHCPHCGRSNHKYWGQWPWYPTHPITTAPPYWWSSGGTYSGPSTVTYNTSTSGVAA